jgi:hypothetical protein
VSEGVGRDGPGEGPRPVDDSSEGNGGMGGGVQMEEDVPPGLVDVEMHLGVGDMQASQMVLQSLAGLWVRGLLGPVLPGQLHPLQSGNGCRCARPN